MLSTSVSLIIIKRNEPQLCGITAGIMNCWIHEANIGKWMNISKHSFEVQVCSIAILNL